MKLSAGTASVTALAASRDTRSAGEVDLVGRALRWLAANRRRARERAELRQLPLRIRQDIGLGRVLDEEATPIWRF